MDVKILADFFPPKSIKHIQFHKQNHLRAGIQESVTWKTSGFKSKTRYFLNKFTELEQLDILTYVSVFMAVKWLDSCLIKFTLWNLNTVWLDIILTTTLQYNLK